MDSAKVKMKIGEHEFEAEGPPDLVQAQLQAFRDMVNSTPQGQVAPFPPQPQQQQNQNFNVIDLALEKIMRHDDRIVSLTVRGESIEDEILLVLLGQNRFRQNDSVTGGEILEGLRQTRGAVNRVDYQLARMAERDGTILSFGTRRARRYRLTNQGIARANQLAAALAQQLP